MRLRLFLIACFVALAFPASAAAIKCAPPSNAGVDQYFETVPGSSCNEPSNGPGSGPRGGSQGSLPPGTSDQLSKEGPAGQAVERLVSSSSTNGTNGRRGGGAGNGSRTGAALSASASGPLSALLGPVLSGSSSGGVGVLLPIFLGVVLVLVLIAVVARRLLGSPGPEA